MISPRIDAMLAGAARDPSAQRIDIDGQPLLVVARPIPPRSNPRASQLLITASLKDARDAARRAALGMGLAVLAAGALLFALQYFLVRGITQPISRLVAMANESRPAGVTCAPPRRRTANCRRWALAERHDREARVL